MILLIDNYDSFSYNLYQLIGDIVLDKSAIKVIRNDELGVSEIEALDPSHIVISPGPGRPSDAGVCEEVITELNGKVPILGVCLGHQAICEALGAKVVHAKSLMHGKQTTMKIEESIIFEGLKNELLVARYHSLAADASTLPSNLKVIGVASDGEIMAVAETNEKTFGLQFHPESILTPDGKRIVQNFLNIK